MPSQSCQVAVVSFIAPLFTIATFTSQFQALFGVSISFTLSNPCPTWEDFVGGSGGFPFPGSGSGSGSGGPLWLPDNVVSLPGSVADSGSGSGSFAYAFLPGSGSGRRHLQGGAPAPSSDVSSILSSLFSGLSGAGPIVDPVARAPEGGDVCCPICR